MKLFFVTGNKNKVEEVRKIIDNIEIEQYEIDLPEYQGDSDFVIEEKAKLAFKKIGEPLFVEDTSFEITAFNKLPGPYIKDFIKNIGAENIPKLLTEFDDKSGTAFTKIAYISEKDKPIIFTGSLRGTVVEPRGSCGFDWDPIFEPEGYSKTFAEMSMEEKNSISHRQKALLKFKEWLDYNS